MQESDKSFFQRCPRLRTERIRHLRSGFKIEEAIAAATAALSNNGNAMAGKEGLSPPSKPRISYLGQGINVKFL